MEIYISNLGIPACVTSNAFLQQNGNINSYVQLLFKNKDVTI